MPSALTMAVAYDGLRHACEHNRSSKQAEARKVEGERAKHISTLLTALNAADIAARPVPVAA